MQPVYLSGKLVQGDSDHRPLPELYLLVLGRFRVADCVPHHGRDASGWVLEGHKWWASGATDPRCHIAIFMGKSSPQAPQHKQQSMILVPLASPGVKIVRPLTVLGFDDAPHGHAEILFQVRSPARQRACRFTYFALLAPTSMHP